MTFDNVDCMERVIAMPAMPEMVRVVYTDVRPK
jgi:hypothetical protein